MILSDEEPIGELEKHAEWVAELKTRHTFTVENISSILKIEVGKVFAKVWSTQEYINSRKKDRWHLRDLSLLLIISKIGG